MLTTLALFRSVRLSTSDWPARSPFAVACVREYQLGQDRWHRASISVRKNVHLAYTSLQRLGYRKIGIVCTIGSLENDAEKRVAAFNKGEGDGDSFILQNSARAELSGFLYHQTFVPEKYRVRPFICLTPFDQTPRDEKFLNSVSEWLADVRPEAVISGDNLILKAAHQAGLKVPEDLAIAHLGLGEDVEGWAGIEPNRYRQASAAVDLLCAQLERNERGIPAYSKSIHIEGDWVDGWTAPSVV